MSEDAANAAAFRALSEAEKKQAEAGVAGAAKGQKIGQYVEGLNKVGEALQSGSRAGAAGILYGAQGLGKLGQYGGAILGGAGKAAQPFENYLLTRGAEDATIHDNILNRLRPKSRQIFQVQSAS